MKKLIIILTFIIPLFCLSQTKKELTARIAAIENAQSGVINEVKILREDNASFKTEIANLKRENELLRQQISNNQAKSQTGETASPATEQNNTVPGQCKAITSKGTQCSRTADVGSEYCWQHKATYEPNSTPTNAVSPTKSSGSSGGSTGSGREIHTGPRGGKYYINSKGNKVYIKK